MRFLSACCTRAPWKRSHLNYLWSFSPFDELIKISMCTLIVNNVATNARVEVQGFCWTGVFQSRWWGKKRERKGKWATATQTDRTPQNASKRTPTATHFVHSCGQQVRHSSINWVRWAVSMTWSGLEICFKMIWLLNRKLGMIMWNNSAASGLSGPLKVLRFSSGF